MNETLKIITATLSVALPIISGLLTFIIKFARSEKARKIAKQLNYLTEKASEYVKKAEQFKNYKGIEKKEFVITKITQDCIIDKVKFDQAKTEEIIEQIVKITKEVNPREQDKINKEELK